jgi:hypothetical protein
VLGLPLVGHQTGGRPHFRVGRIYLILQSGKPRPAGPDPFPALAFAVDDLAGAAANLQAHGIELPWGIEGEGQSRWVKFYDPAGNLIELVEGKLSA